MINKIAYPMTDNRGLFLKIRYPLNFDKVKNEWLIPGGCIDFKLPEIVEGQIAVLNPDKTDWEYYEDKSGKWYDKKTKEETMTQDPYFSSESQTQLKPLDEDCYFDEINTKWVVDIELYKKTKKGIIGQNFKNALQLGHFFSNTLQIEIDCRRSSENNDLQNLEGLIDIMTIDGVEFYPYFGYTETNSSTTVEMLQLVKIEMKRYFISLYNKKWIKEASITSTNDLDALIDIVWEEE